MANNDSIPLKDRASGAVMGAFIGDALGVGPHWYYDLAELRRDYGDWIYRLYGTRSRIVTTPA